ncbi:NADH-ubiquinone oxidoreductase chain N [hydrothermal vent metagenome]|uniref:NADH-ubiquinone oxidoreductase chain N n=1 Tax=hydrothermal vent metagenome TaxID=652676 RepID=A0A1W1EDY9_9ZZZZ
MSSIYFVALPLLFGFAIPILNKFGKNAVAYASTAMQIALFILAISLMANTFWAVEIISINPPLGISFVLNKASLMFVLLFTFLMMMFSIYYLTLRKTDAFKDENKFFILINMILASSIGLVLSSDLFNIYVFFEIAGISAYILSSYKKTPSALEAGIKYLLTGMLASVFLVFAIFLVYIHLGSLNLAVISQTFHTLDFNMKLLISIFLFIGFGFKVEIFPLNFWVTDVYEGSTSLVNSLFSSIVVKAYLFVFFHILYLFMPDSEFTPFLLLTGAVSMLAAEIVALKQKNLKRVFAYSSLGQVGLIFAVLSLGSPAAVAAGFFIIVSHSIAKMIIFLSITTIEHEHKSVDITTLKELNSPFITLMMVLSMLSLLGIPLFAGFVGKFLALKTFAASSTFLVLGIIIVASLIESIYYFKITGNLFTKGEKRAKLRLSLSQKVLFSVLATLLIVIGTLPFLFSGYIHEASLVMTDTASYVNILVGGTK